MKPDIEKLIAILEKVLNREMPDSNARKEIVAFSSDELDSVYANLFHYLDDEDIRNKDSRYKDFQDTEMKKLIQFLKTGDLSKANEISFLSRTPKL